MLGRGANATLFYEVPPNQCTCSNSNCGNRSLTINTTTNTTLRNSLTWIEANSRSGPLLLIYLLVSH